MNETSLSPNDLENEVLPKTNLPDSGSSTFEHPCNALDFALAMKTKEKVSLRQTGEESIRKYQLLHKD
ncbi:hypothetical protein OIU85_021252 [Salix viminalis]|uniref:Uncharacterized protein n=1 Tax=Salix viminalis TaxID=40686 RepID=A0A9Q0ZDL5_SALVM|nr:hypothetical protein OIU85_021252 [Salix viminalis]